MRGLPLLLLGVAACTFPTIDFDDGGGNGGTPTVGGGGAGGSTNVTGGDPVGAGGEGAGLIEGGGGSGAGGGPADPCDADGDGFYPQVEGCDNGLEFDCYDDNARARPNQTDTFPVDRGDGSFDYDCDGVERPFYETTCSCNNQALGVTAGADGCGDEGVLRKCDAFLTCGAKTVVDSTVKQKCN